MVRFLFKRGKLNNMRIPFFLCVVLFLSCNQKQTEKLSSDPVSDLNTVTTETDTQITCWGVGSVDLGDDLKTIEEKIGKDRISTDSLFLEGMFERLISVIDQGKPTELKIHWQETKPTFNTIRYIEISNPKSVYQFANGIKVGISLAELVKLNEGKALQLHGFGWDYGGTFIDFGEGTLKGDIPCFGGVFAFQGSANIPSEISGEQKISSDHPALQQQEIKLVKITINNR